MPWPDTLFCKAILGRPGDGSVWEVEVDPRGISVPGFGAAQPDPTWPVLESDFLRVSVLWHRSESWRFSECAGDVPHRSGFLRHVQARVLLQDRTGLLVHPGPYGLVTTLTATKHPFDLGLGLVDASAPSLPRAAALTVYKMGLGIWFSSEEGGR
jgi:hypothetical protein